jgi:hypothetical protein
MANRNLIKNQKDKPKYCMFVKIAVEQRVPTNYMIGLCSLRARKFDIEEDCWIISG